MLKGHSDGWVESLKNAQHQPSSCQWGVWRCKRRNAFLLERKSSRNCSWLPWKDVQNLDETGVLDVHYVREIVGKMLECKGGKWSKHRATINHAGRAWVSRDAMKNGHPIQCVMRLMLTYLWSSNIGKGTHGYTPSTRSRHLQGTKLASSQIMICSSFSYSSCHRICSTIT